MNKYDSVDLTNVKVGGELGRRIDLTLNELLLNVDVERIFLDWVRRKDYPGFTKMATGGYLGVGKFIDAANQFARYTHDDRVAAFKTHLVDEVLRWQLPDGYLGVMQQDLRLNGYWDLNEILYIILALVNDYQWCGNRAALAAAARQADYIIENQQSIYAPMDLIKMNTERAFLALSEATGDNKYRDYAIERVKLREWQEPVIGQHAYSFINMCLAQLDLYDRESSPVLLNTSHSVIDFLTKQDGLLIHGSCSRKELFHDTQESITDIAETCATAYLIRLLDKLLQIEANSLYGDMMERTIFNALLAAQSPDGKRVRYHTPTEGKRQYCTERWPELVEHTFCCPNNFKRIMPLLPALVYYQSDTNGLLVNIYTRSHATLQIGNHAVQVSQTTDYPTSGRVEIQIAPDEPMSFPIGLRIPAWSHTSLISINGATEEVVRPGSFYTVERKWQRADCIMLDLSMPWRWIKGRKLQEGRVALMRGPMLFCLNPQQSPNVNIKEITLDVASTPELLNDESIRPGGIACRVKTAAHDSDLILTEFPDPGGEAVYFLPSEDNRTIDDELNLKGS